MVEYNGAVTGAGETTYLAGTEYWSFYYYKAYFQTTATTETMQVEIGRSFDINEFLVPANRAALPLGGGQQFYRDACFTESQSIPHKWTITPQTGPCVFNRAVRMAILESEVPHIRLNDFVELLAFGPAKLVKRDSMRNISDFRVGMFFVNGGNYLDVRSGWSNMIISPTGGYPPNKIRGQSLGGFTSKQSTSYRYTIWSTPTDTKSRSFVFNFRNSRCAAGSNLFQLNVNFPAPALSFVLKVATSPVNQNVYVIYRQMMQSSGTLTDLTVPIAQMDLTDSSMKSMSVKITLTPSVFRNQTPDSFATGQYYHLVYEIVTGWYSPDDPLRGQIFRENNYWVESGYASFTSQASTAHYVHFTGTSGCSQTFREIILFEGGASFGMMGLNTSIMQYSSAWDNRRRNLEDFELSYFKDIFTKMSYGCTFSELNNYFDQERGECLPCPRTGKMQGCVLCDDRDQCLGFEGKYGFLFPTQRDDLVSVGQLCRHDNYYFTHHKVHEPAIDLNKLFGCSICPPNCRTCLANSFCNTCSPFSTKSGTVCNCNVANCAVCQLQGCEICKEGFTMYANIATPPTRTLSCQPASVPENCSALGGYIIHRNSTSIHCANANCDLGYFYDVASSECHACADNSYGSCTAGKMIQITQRDEKYQLAAWVSGNYQVAASIVTGLTNADNYYGCDRVDGNNNCVRCLPGFHLAPLGRSLWRCFCPAHTFYHTGSRSCVPCAHTNSKNYQKLISSLLVLQCNQRYFLRCRWKEDTARQYFRMQLPTRNLSSRKRLPCLRYFM